MNSKKRKLTIALTLAAVFGIILYLGIREPDFFLEIFQSKKPMPEEWKGDKSEPVSQIRGPEIGSWQSRDFSILVLDEDLESGLDSKNCQYKALSYDNSGREFSSDWYRRKCNDLAWISVGSDKWCWQEGRNSCWVYVSAFDQAGNRHLPEEEKGSVKSYNVDWTSPETGQVSLGAGQVRVSVKDNLKVAGCRFYLDDHDLGWGQFSVPGCQKECRASLDFTETLEPGEHQLRAVCWDAAGNSGQGQALSLKENQGPKISSCRVQPAQGNTATDFRFSSEADDPDNDELVFSWEFGDGKTSNEKNAVHRYSKSGTFEPKVRVTDGRGLEDFCQTAWVIVGE